MTDVEYGQVPEQVRTPALDRIHSHDQWKVKIPEFYLERIESDQDTSYLRDIKADHVETDGRLQFRTPTQDHFEDSHRVIDGGLVQPLSDPERIGRNDEFFNQLQETHAAIAERHLDSEYTSSTSVDEYWLGSLLVPQDYEEPEIDQGLDQLGATSRETQEMHDEVMATLSEYGEQQR